MANQSRLQLKKLQSQRFAVQQEISHLSAQRSAMNREMERLKTQYDSLQAQIRRIETEGQTLTVSEHAILRYLQRVKGMDMEAVARELCPDTSHRMILGLGTGTYPIPGGPVPFRICVEGTVVTTVLVGEKEDK